VQVFHRVVHEGGWLPTLDPLQSATLPSQQPLFELAESACSLFCYVLVLVHDLLFIKFISAFYIGFIQWVCLYSIYNCFGMGRSRKDPYSPHEGNFCRPEGEGDVLGHPKGVYRGVNFLFPLWGWYGCFLEWPNMAENINLDMFTYLTECFLVRSQINN
jgi:hypothetical protein